MNSILTTNSEVSRAQQQNPSTDVETTGSIAMTDYSPIFSIPVVNYDMFIPTNPFSLNIDFGSYAEQEANTLANNSSFMQGFASALAALTEGGNSFGSYTCAGASSASAGGCAGGSCSVGGGFTSVG